MQLQFVLSTTLLAIGALGSCTCSPNFCAGKTNGNYPNPASKNTFISCSNGTPYCMECATSDLVFDQTQNACVYSNTGECDPTQNYPREFCNGKPNENFRNPLDIHSYIACSNGIEYVMPCASGLVYNDMPRPWGECDYPAGQTCDSAYKSICCGVAQGTKKPIPGKCNQYVTCCGNEQGGNLGQCPSGLAFNARTQKCDQPENCNCKRSLRASRV